MSRCRGLALAIHAASSGANFSLALIYSDIGIGTSGAQLLATGDFPRSSPEHSGRTSRFSTHDISAK